MNKTKRNNYSMHKPWKKALCVILSILIAFGTFVVFTFGNSKFQRWLGIHSVLSAYAAETVDTKGAIAVDEEAMLADDHTINLENKDGSNTVYLFSEPISYTDENGNLKTKDISVEKADKELKSKGYDYTNGQNDYRINFSKDCNKGVQAEFDNCSYSIIPISDYDTVGKETVAQYLNEKFEVFQYKNIYGDGTNLRFYPQLNGIKDEIVLDSNIGKNTFSFKIETNDCTPSLDDDGEVVLKNTDNEVVQIFSKPFAYDSDFVEGIYDEHYSECEYSLEKIADGSYMLTVSVDEKWLENDNTTYPVVIDPTTGDSVYTEDAGIYTGYANNNYGYEQTGCMGRDRVYGYGRVLTYFPMPSAIKKAATINSAYSWQRETTGAPTVSYIRPYILVSGWTEGSVTWNNRPSYRTAVVMPQKLINSKSTDKASSVYWYKFDIAAAVQAWSDNSYHNYGLLFISSDDLNGTYDWRAFASRSYSTSAMRPYYVINYTNDTVAPTVSSVTGNATDWTNANVTLTVNGAKDNDGGIGLHTTAYSFSTSKDTYSWQKENYKTFSSNCTVYVYVRDAWDNKRLVSTQTVNKIDKDAPSTPTVTGNPEDWTTDKVTLTASSSDSASGIKDYSFSTAQGVYSWQTENTKQFDENATVYIYARDNAGNISAASEVVIDKIDNSFPTGTVDYNHSSEWVKSIKIKADVLDELSGLSKNGYSFSLTEGEYIWQSEDSKIITENGTYFVYVKDNAGNISLIDTVKINNIDNTAPEIKEITINNDSKTVITVNAQDEQSGILAYSIDDGKTWQSSNVFEIPKDSVNFIAVKVKDILNNVNTYAEYRDIFTPQIYYDGDKIGIYNPNINVDYSDCELYYSIEKPTHMNNWKYYESPFIVPDNCHEIYVSFYRNNNLSDIRAVPIENKNVNYFDYTEVDTDLSLSYKGVDFNIERRYKSQKWYYSVDSSFNVINNNIIQVALPDFTELRYVKRNKYLYSCESKYSSIIVIYDTTDTYIKEYICNYKEVNYHYNLDGKLIKISNSNGDLFEFSYELNHIVITDCADRKTVLKFKNDKLISVTDANNGILQYIYDNHNLIKVIDQAGVILNEYVYDNNELVKSGYNNIYRDSKDRVVRIVADNGSFNEYEYNEDEVVVSYSDFSINPVKYDYYGNIISSIDENGDSIKCFYDNSNRLESVFKNGDFLERYYYDEKGRLIEKNNSTGYYWYDYNDNDYLYQIVDYKYTATDKASVTHYAYDSSGNIIIKADFTVDYRLLKDCPDSYDSNYKYDSIIRYEYNNGLLIKIIENNNEVINTYDKYSNNIKSVTTLVQDDVTTVSISESKYDILGRLVSSISDNSVITYIYDDAGRTLLTNADDNYTRIVYDDRGRVIQEINNNDYNSENDNLPKNYNDDNVGIRYTYDNVGNLVKEINESNIEINYEYSNIGSLLKKSFDIYDYYYQDDGKCNRIDVNGNLYAEFAYNIENSDENSNYYNTVTYADGYVEKYKYDNDNNVISKYANDNIFYVITSANKNELIYFENGINVKNIITSNDSLYSYVKKDYSKSYYEFKYEVSLNDETKIKTINENHGSYNYKTIIDNNKVNFISANSEFDYFITSDENVSTKLIKKDSQDILSSTVSFDENTNSFIKSYDSLELEYKTVYDDNGNIISDEINDYIYNESGELVRSSGVTDSSFTYDSRGNLLSKTCDNVTTVFSYDNKDNLLISVDDRLIQYNENGNIVLNGDTKYAWTRNNLLKYISNADDGSFSYKYDSNGDRVCKDINGVNTYFNVVNGKILEQHDKYNTMYFQYYEDTLVGFILNNVQYYYITNLNGDIVAIADSNGNLVAKYSYDVWGKVLDVKPAQDNNEEQLTVAQLNPFRYRGYYYDTESGLYYCNSRYYSPELCRFISPVDINSIEPSSKYTLNAYVYCYNRPTVYTSYNNSCKASISNDTKQILQNCLSEIKTINNLLKEVAEVEKDKLKEQAHKLVEKTNKLYKNIKSKCNNIIDKLEYFLNYPDVELNKLLSKLLNKDINIRFRLINFFREKTNLKIDLSILKNIFNKNIFTLFSNNDLAEAVVKTITIVIELNWLDELLNSINYSLEKMAEKSFEQMQSFAFAFVRLFNVTFDYISLDFFTDLLSDFSSGFLSKADDYVPKGDNLKGVGTNFGLVISIFSYIVSLNDLGKGNLSFSTDFLASTGKFFSDIISFVTTIIFPESIFATVFSIVLPYASNILIDYFALKKENKFFK